MFYCLFYFSDVSIMWQFIQMIVERREVLTHLVGRELKTRYRGSVLGFFWSILTPLFMAMVYVVFLHILTHGRASIEGLIVGIFAWNYTAQCVTGGMDCVVGSTNLIKKVAFPRVLLPMATNLAALVNYLLSLIVQFLVLSLILALKSGDDILSPQLLLMPLIIAYHFMFNLSVGMILAGFNVYFRDTQHLVGVMLTAWFFMSPTMYDYSFIANIAAGGKPVNVLLANLYLLNPMACVLTAYRAVLLPGVSFPWSAWSIAGWLWPIGFVAFAFFLFHRMQRHFADYL